MGNSMNCENQARRFPIAISKVAIVFGIAMLLVIAGVVSLSTTATHWDGAY